MRRVEQLEATWDFTGPDGTTQALTIPHTWNAQDGQDGGNDYWRGTCTYKTAFPMPADVDLTEQRVWLEFLGVNSTADVKLNGQDVIHHDGGYSTFRADVTDLLSTDNALEVKVDNSVNDRIYPQKADFTFYGGIYRPINFVIVDRTHFSLGYIGGPGIKVTPTPKDGAGEVHAECWLEGVTDDDQVEVQVAIKDADGTVVAEGTGTDATLTVPNCHLWDGMEDPYLYTAEFTLVRDGKAVDATSCRFGFRTFRVDPDEGFFLNGRSYPLHGVSRHQDRKGIGNAINDDMHREDIEMIKEVGANTIRLAHYQHSQTFYDLCDEMGFIVWAEIPYISEHLPNGRENTISQMKELITQNYNHTSICVWGVSNEITISTKDKADMLDNHHVLNDLVHEMDPTRLTTLACYAACGPFNKVAHITDLVSWNLYLGWYVPGFILNDLWMWFFHKCYPNRCLGFSEYGAEGMPNLHSSRPHTGDHSEEYQAVYHEYMLKCFDRHPYLWATHLWNMYDFAADMRDQGGEPGMNHKGLVTFDRKTKKDSFYLYKAYWSDDPFVHICSKRYVDRPEKTTQVKVYTNQPEVTLLVDGQPFCTKKGEKVFSFYVPVSAEGTKVEAVCGSLHDEATFDYVKKPNPAYAMPKGKKQKSNWT